MATRSAIRTGWLVTGLSGKMPEPTWMRSVCASANAMNDSLADRCEYSVKVWCSVHHTYFQLFRSASRISSSSFSTAPCSEAGS